MITINITGDNAEDVFGQIRALACVSGGTVISVTEKGPVTVTPPQTPSAKDVFSAAVEAVAEAPVVEAPKEKKPRKPKETAPVAAPAPVPSNLPASEEPTLDNARLWIKAVVASDGANGDSGGLEAAQKILTGLGVGKVSEMPAEKYNLLIADSKKFLTSKADIL